LRENQNGGEQPFYGGLCAGRRDECREYRVVRSGRHCAEGWMKQQSEQTDGGLDDGVQYQWIAQPLAVSPDEERADRHSTEEDGEHDDLGVRAMADQQSQIACPDRFVNEARGARQKEERIE